MLNLLTTWKLRLKSNTKEIKKSICFSNDEGIKESQHSNSKHKESCDTIRSLQEKMFFRREDRSIASQKRKSVKSTRARRAIDPKKNNETSLNAKKEFKLLDIHAQSYIA